MQSNVKGMGPAIDKSATALCMYKIDESVFYEIFL